MEYLIPRETEFNKCLTRMKRAGGATSRAANQVWMILGQARAGRADELGTLTNHGESRIPNCVKYDLSGFCRLVTVRHKDALFFLMAGNHDDTERWIESHRGLRPVIDKKTKRLQLIHEVGVAPTRPLPEQAPSGRPIATPRILHQLIDANVSQATVDAIRVLEDTATDDELIEIATSVSQPAQSDALMDVLADLRDGREESALARLALLRGDAIRAEESPELLMEAASDEINSDQIVRVGDLSDDDFARLSGSDHFEDWLLYLHPDQRRVADGQFPAPVVLGGVSGSGKTTVVLHRAKHLARRLAGARIGIFVLNDALAELLAYLKDRLCSPALAQRIDVVSLRNFLIGCCKGNHAVADPLVLDEIWQETYEACAKDLEPIIRALNARNLDAARYIRDEFRWLHSGFARRPADGLLTRTDYLVPAKAPRDGRAVPFSSDWRERVLLALAAYERALDTRGLWDPEALGMLAAEGEIKATYRAVLVDEYQDLGVLELRALLRTAVAAPDAVFLAGDARQQVFPKRMNLAEAGLAAPIRRRFQKNYRNTQEILDCAWEMLQGSALGEEGGGLDEADRLKPELSARHGDRPAVVRAEGPDEERAFVAAYVKEHRRTSDAPVCICICGVRDDETEHIQNMVDAYRDLGLEARLLSGDAKPQPGVTSLASLETVKGFEFPLVLITQCGAQQIPNPGQPDEEAWRDARRLYVAMTRARDELVISHFGEPSAFIDACGEKANRTTVEDLLGYVPEPAFVVPVPTAPEHPMPAAPEPPPASPAQPEPIPPAPPVPAAPRPLPVPSPEVAPAFVPPPAAPRLLPAAQVLHSLGLEVIDKRGPGGALWVVGGSNLRELMQRLNRLGFAFVFKAEGGRASGRRPAWWTRLAPDTLPDPRDFR
ncbi:MAG: AAA family ATPase [Vicinamibacteria bacterium]|nr:AAA family ATPase [Vicinamibacteria bacterium]